MKQIHQILTFITLSLILQGCSSCGSRRTKVAPEAVNITQVNGNIITLLDGREVQLLGVQNTPQVEEFLARNLTEKVTLVFDSKSPPKSSKTTRSSNRRNKKEDTSKNAEKTKLYGYIITESGVSINAELLKFKISALQTDKLHDSLKVFRSYAEATAAVKNQNIQPAAPPSHAPSNVVELLQSASFLVRTYDRNGTPIGTGSGFFVGNGVGVSNSHVFESGEMFTIQLCGSDQEYDVTEIIRQDPNIDYVVFKVDMKGQSCNTLKRAADYPKQLDDILVYGNPNGLLCTITRGVVSAFRKVENRDVIQIDAAISPGSSGSPVVNLQGDLIGIATFKKTGCENCNFAVDVHELNF
jgi:serine protease Do